MARTTSNRYRRNQHGSMTVLIVLCLTGALVFMFLPCLNFAEALLVRQQQCTALEESALAAAKDISEIVINDSYFGYIGFTDHAPIGKTTLAADGQPLPVMGINTLWANCRNELLMADILDNEELRALALRDIAEARRLNLDLAKVAIQSLKPGAKGAGLNVDGEPLKPFDDALKMFTVKTLNNSTAAARYGSTLKLSIGWLDDVCDSRTPLPRPFRLGQLNEQQCCQGNYKAFVNVPVRGENIYLAGFAEQPALVAPQNFRLPDGKRICTIVRAESDVSVPACYLWQLITGQKQITVHCAACAEPQANPDITLPGILRVGFASGLIPGIDSLADLLSYSRLTSQKNDLLKPVGGDYPLDAHASLVVAERQQQTPKIVARGLFDWIRSTHNKARLDAIAQVVTTPFKQLTYGGSGTASEPSFVYEFDNNGALLVTNEKHTPFLEETVFESQLYSVAPKAVASVDQSWTLSFRDQVASMGTVNGGKHAGQPMPGNPINWSELPYYDGSAAQATRKASGMSRGLTPVGDNKSCEGGNDAVSVDSTVFKSLAMKDLAVQPRKTYYASGLAVEMRFSEAANVEVAGDI